VDRPEKNKVALMRADSSSGDEMEVDSGSEDVKQQPRVQRKASVGM
jgi:hypothetical protein